MPRRKRDWDEPVSEKVDNNRRAYTYPLTNPEWIEMYGGQQGKCALCNRELIVRADAVVDHNHETGKARGILCSGCNSRISYFADNAERLAKIVGYAKLGYW